MPLVLGERDPLSVFEWAEGLFSSSLLFTFPSFLSCFLSICIPLSPADSINQLYLDRQLSDFLSLPKTLILLLSLKIDTKVYSFVILNTFKSLKNRIYRPPEILYTQGPKSPNTPAIFCTMFTSSAIFLPAYSRFESLVFFYTSA